MTQPRKEQIKNLKTKYIRFAQSGTLVLTGGPVQTIYNTIGESYYDEFLASTVSQLVGGAETSSPATIYGGYGPFTVAVNATINFIIPGVNGGLSVPVIFQSSDFVLLSGASRLTTWRAANRINLALAAYGVTAPVAFNVDGQLVLKAANSTGVLYGSSSSLSLTDVTVGAISSLGLGTSNSVSAVGVQGPTRGIITNSQDGLGGYIQLRSIDSSSLEPKNSQMMHIGARNYAPRYFPGQPAFARLQAFPGADLNGKNFRVTYWRKGPKRPSLFTSQGSSKSNFSSIISGEQATISLDMGGGLGLTTAFTVTFGIITTVQQVVDAFNAGWTASSLLSFGVEASRASVKLGLPGPYRFSNPLTRDSFFVSFNVNTAVHIKPSAGVYTTANLITYINSQIALAGQTAEGEAISFTDPDGNTRVVIQSKKTIAAQSSVQIYPGNPGGSVPGTFMETLDMLGMSPGLYSGTNIAELYGSDEIQFTNPSAFPSSSITVSFSSALVAPKLGLLTTQSAVQTTDFDKIVVPQAIALIPEMLEFSEEPDNYDPTIQLFDLPGTIKGALATDGVANANLASILGLDGKIGADFIPRILGFLGADQLRLGSGLLGSIADQLSPRLFTEQISANGPVLIWEGMPTSGATASNAISRLYSDNGTIYLTYNANYQSGATPWVRDTVLQNSYLIEIVAGKLSVGIIKTTDTSPWATSSWKRNFKFNTTEISDSIYGTEILNIGESLVTGTSPLTTRAKFPVVQDTTNPTLLFSFVAPSGVSARVYYISLSGDVALPPFLNSTTLGITVPTPTPNSPASGSSFIFITENAYYDSTTLTWNKDITGKYATMLSIGQSGLSFSRMIADLAWTHSAWPGVVSIDSVTGTMTLGAAAQDPVSPRLSMNRFDPTNEYRTLLFESPITTTNATAPIRIYVNSGLAYAGQGLVFTRNCLWDSVTNQWSLEVPNFDGVAVHIGNANSTHFAVTSKQQPSASWDDTELGWGAENALKVYSTGTRYTIGIAETGYTIIPLPIWSPGGSSGVQLWHISSDSTVISWRQITPAVQSFLFAPISGIVPRGVTITSVEYTYATGAGYPTGGAVASVDKMTGLTSLTQLVNEDIVTGFPSGTTSTLTLPTPTLESTDPLFFKIRTTGTYTNSGANFYKLKVNWTRTILQ